MARGRYRFDHGLVQEHLLQQLGQLPAGNEHKVAVAEALVRHFMWQRRSANPRAAELLREAGEDVAAYEALCEAAFHASWSGATESSQELLRRGRKWLQDDGAVGDHPGRALVLLEEARRLSYMLDYANAAQLTDEAMEMFTRLGNHSMAAFAASLRAALRMYASDYRGAREMGLDALASAGTANRIDMKTGVSASDLLARLAYREGRLEEARDYFKQTRRYAALLGESWRIHLVDGILAEMELALGNVDTAREYLDASLAAARSSGDEAVIWDMAPVEALFHLRSGSAQSAREHLQPFLERAVANDDQWRIGAARLLMAILSAELDGDEDAERAALRAIEDCRKSGQDDIRSLIELRDKLAVRGLESAAAEVEALRAETHRRLARGFGHDDS